MLGNWPRSLQPARHFSTHVAVVRGSVCSAPSKAGKQARARKKVLWKCVQIDSAQALLIFVKNNCRYYRLINNNETYFERCCQRLLTHSTCHKRQYSELHPKRKKSAKQSLQVQIEAKQIPCDHRRRQIKCKKVS